MVLPPVRIRRSAAILTAALLSMGGLFCSSERVARRDLTTLRLDSLLAVADSLRGEGELDGAEELYAEAVKRPGNSIRGQRGLGRIALAKREWGDAISAADKIERLDSSDLTATYLRAFAHRERGITQPLHIEWRASRREFESILARDSSFEDALYQFALLERYREEYRHMIELGDRQLVLKPGRGDLQLGVHRLYRCYVAIQDTAEVLGWLRERGGGLAVYYRGEALRRSGALGEAESLAASGPLRVREVPPEAWYLSLARIRFAAGDRDGAERWYWRAVNELSSQLGAALLFQDLKYIVTDEELGQFRRLTSIAARREFFRSFWTFRNPSPAAAENPRLREHIRRFLVAEQRYEYYGFRLWFNNPDRLNDLEFPRAFQANEEFNDMGLVYLRHGEPGDVVRAMMEGSWDPAESWLYFGDATMPRLTFHFEKHNAAGNNWRLTAVPRNLSLVEDLQMWDVRYRQLLYGTEMDRGNAEDRLRYESREVVSYAMRTDEHTWEQKVTPMYIPHSADMFRAKESRGLIDISYAIPLSPAAQALGEEPTRVAYEVGLALTESRSRRSVTQLDTLPFTLSSASRGYFVDLRRFTVLPDSYLVSMHIRAIGGPLFGSWKQGLRVRDFKPTEFAVSSVQLLFPSREKTILEIDGIKVRQSPFVRQDRSQPLYVYFQVYGLVKDDFGKTGYRVEYLLIPADEKDDGGGDVLLLKDRNGSEESAAEFTSLDLRETGAGVYRLVVRVTDRKRVQTVRGERTIEIVKP
jgi:hypothetical protein